MSTIKHQCPQCCGNGIISAAFNSGFSVFCDLCEGAGKVKDEKMQWREMGRAIKARRIEAGIGLKQASEKLKIDAASLSRMERGCDNPMRLVYPL